MRIKDPKVTGPVPASREPIEAPDAETLDDGQAALDDHAIFARIPLHMRTGVDGEAGAYHEVTGRDATAGMTHLAAGRSTTVEAGLDGGAWGELTRAGPGGASHTGVYYQPGWAEMWHEVDWASAGGTNRAGAAAIISADELGLGFTVGRTVGDVTGYGLFAALARADRELKDLGPGKHGRRVELRTSSGKSLLARPGVGFASFGIGGQLSVRRDKDVVMRAEIPRDDARTALNEPKGVLRFFKDRLRATGLSEDPVEVPDLTNPEALAVGDELVVSTSGSVSGGVFVGAVAGIGAQAIVRGDFELAVKKHDDNHVELAVTPRRMRGGQIRASAALLADIDASRFSAESFRQSFVFDLDDPVAKAAYLLALQGELPGGWPDGKAQPKVDPDDDVEVRFHEVIAQEPMPSGVKRTFVELVDTGRKQRGFGLGFGVWRRGAAFIGLGKDHLDTRSTRTRVGANHAGRSETRVLEDRRYTLISGIETEGVYASLRRSTVFDDEGRPTRSFNGLVLEGRLSDTKVRGEELNHDFIDTFKEAFGVQLPYVSQPGAKEAREVRVVRVIDEAGLDKLQQSALDPALSDAMKAATTTEAKADAVSAWVAEHGLAGLGGIHQILGGPLEVSTSADLYDNALDQARSLKFRYEAAVPVDKERIKRRFGEVEKLQAKLDKAIALAAEDPFVDDNQALVQALLSAGQGLDKLVDVGHLTRTQRLKLADELRAGWCTGLEDRIALTLVPGHERTPVSSR